MTRLTRGLDKVDEVDPAGRSIRSMKSISSRPACAGGILGTGWLTGYPRSARSAGNVNLVNLVNLVRPLDPQKPQAEFHLASPTDSAEEPQKRGTSMFDLGGPTTSQIGCRGLGCRQSGIVKPKWLCHSFIRSRTGLPHFTLCLCRSVPLCPVFH